ncbi:hypothetical protein X777_14527, partial [Ooceraea biroi]
LRRFIKTGKDSTNRMSHCNVVYKISCNNCEASYVDQTKGSPSVILTHRMEYGHDFKWNKVQNFDEERSFKED